MTREVKNISFKQLCEMKLWMNICEFLENDEFLKIVLISELHSVEMIFSRFIGYRKFSADARFHMISSVGGFNCTFHTAESSEFVDWYLEESGPFAQPENLKHCQIVTDFEVVDILCNYEPVVKISESKLQG